MSSAPLTGSQSACSGSGAHRQANGPVGLQGPGAAEASPGGKSGHSSLGTASRHTDAAGATGKRLVQEESGDVRRLEEIQNVVISLSVM